MDGVLDGGSPRRGSLTSLHRQSSGSFSHNPKIASPSSSAQATNSLYKDLDKFTRYFIIKAVQVIVQSRISRNRKVKTECKSTGNDWFNINIPDIAEVSGCTKTAIDTEGFSVKSNWRVCCEISLRTSDGGSVILEHWIISNRVNLNSIHNGLPSKLCNNQMIPKSNIAHRSSQSIISNIGIGSLSPNLTTPPRNSPGSLCNKIRSRLNSIDDCSEDTSKPLNGLNNENLDLKSSTSCYSLSSAPINSSNDTNVTITTSPSINSLSNNQTQSQSTNSANSSAAYGTKTSTISSIYTIYNRMSLLLKTLMTATHIVPAYRLASRASDVDSCVICYRVYVCPVQSLAPLRGSIEDINSNLNHESPTKRSSSSNLSYGAVNIREFVGVNELDHFCPILKLGSIKTDVNELEVSLCYRNDVKNSNQQVRSPLSREMYNKILNEECITAAKQLLAGNDNANQDSYFIDGIKSDLHSENLNRQEFESTDVDKPLRPAFAKELKVEKNALDPSLLIVESAFDSLLQINSSSTKDSLVVETDLVNKVEKNLDRGGSNSRDISTNPQSDPIQVPARSKQVELCQNLSSGSTPKSLTDSFVFVDLNPPFASEEHNDINSFFHGPSPAFANGFDSLKDVEELTNQLELIEANASQIDEFVDNICVSEDEEEG